jgi:hypothetical protein
MYKDYPAAYQVSKGAALQVDKAFYDRVRESGENRPWSSSSKYRSALVAPGKCRRAMFFA